MRPWGMYARRVTLTLAVLMTAAIACEKDPAPPQTPTADPGPSGEAGDEPEAYDPCAGKSCGDACTLCAPDDSDCAETMSVKQCSADGACTDQAVSC